VARFVRHVRLASEADTARYPFTLPAVAWLIHSDGLALAPGVTFLVGENGSGKSTVVEAIAPVPPWPGRLVRRTSRLTAGRCDNPWLTRLVLPVG